MLTPVQASILGILQGATELFPISSLGHSVLVPQLLGWHIDEASSEFVAFLVATHAATALVLLLFFWRDWLKILTGIARSLQTRELAGDTYAKLGWMLIIATIPAGLLGLLFEKKFTALFSAATIVASALLLNGIVLLMAEWLRRRAAEGPAQDERTAALSWLQTLFIGIAQCFALIPGFSRTGLTMTGGLLAGLSHENAARFSFLLATPIIGAAALLKLPHLVEGGGTYLQTALLGALLAGITSYLSVKFLLKYFETKTLKPFAAYCIVAGAIALIVLH